MTTFAKVALTKTQKQRAAIAKRVEHMAKLAAKWRDDFTCRRCRSVEATSMEAAHIHGAGAGGNPDGSRSDRAACFITLCHRCHQGPRSVHSGHVRIVAGPAGGDGPVSFTPVVTKTIGAHRSAVVTE